MNPEMPHIQKKQQQVRGCILLLAALFFMFSFSPYATAAPPSRENRFPELIAEGGYLVGGENHELVYQENKLFLPASTLKILTSLAAFDLLGPDFRFETHLYLDASNNLYIKGLGDPFLTSEEILLLCISLRELGVTSVQKVFLDCSAFNIAKNTPGSLGSNNPYDAPNGALAVNFNSIAINKHTDGTVVSAEPQTPTLDIMRVVAKDLPPGKQRININSVTSNTVLSFPEQYAGELFVAQLQKAGIPVAHPFEKKVIPQNLTPVLQYKNSKTLQEVMGECLLYSNNFIANQVFLYCSTRGGTIPATWKRSRSFIKSYLTTHLGISPTEFAVYDGAGLSRQNKITARSLVTILQNFLPYKNLLPQKHGLFVKSGTLKGVYCYAGYLNVHGHSVAFAILLNQQKNTRDALIKQLQHLYSTGT